MISDKLYSMAFKFKKKKVWNIILNVHVFAVKFSDGNTGYINITNSVNGRSCLTIYLGDKGFNCLRTITELDKILTDSFSPFKFQEALIQQECIKCLFVGKNQLTEEEQEEIKNYTASHDIRLSGKNAYPQFIKYTTNCIPVLFLTEQEQEYLCEAFSASMALADILINDMNYTLGMTQIYDDPDTVVSLKLKGGKYITEEIPVPEKISPSYPSPKATNDIAVAKLKKQKKVGIWECEIIRFPQPVQNSPEEIPNYPVVLIAIESATDYFLSISPVSHYEENPDHLIDNFIDSFLQHELCPKEIKVRDERTYAFAEDICKKLKISLSFEKELKVLEEAELTFWDRFGIPEQEKPQEDKVTPISVRQSYIISVSLGSGCYRHIQISGNSKLSDLHTSILNAFELKEEDHEHGFFMDNKIWSNENCYLANPPYPEFPSTYDYRLSQIGLSKGKQFKYLFDFRNEWKFQCKVLQVTDTDIKKTIVIKSKGDAPVSK